MRPVFKVTANDADATSAIAARLKNIRITDEADDTSDTLEIALADSDPDEPLEIPETGAELRVSIGYDGEPLRDMGLYVVDEVELSGPPNEMVIRARAAVLEKSKGGKTALQSQKTRSWKKGTTVGALVKTIASEHGLTASVSAQLASIALPQLSQSSESDLNLLHRLAKKYDAIAKPAGGRLLFVNRGEGKTASGDPMPTARLNLDDVSDWRIVIAKRESAGSVVAKYRDTKQAKTFEVTVGTGEPVQRIRQAFADEASARKAAESRARSRARGEKTLSITRPGDASIIAETKLQLVGFRPGIPTNWIVSRVEHYIGPDGFKTSLEAELPNSEIRAGKAAKAAQTAIEEA